MNVFTENHFSSGREKFFKYPEFTDALSYSIIESGVSHHSVSIEKKSIDITEYSVGFTNSYSIYLQAREQKIRIQQNYL